MEMSTAVATPAVKLRAGQHVVRKDGEPGRGEDRVHGVVYFRRGGHAWVTWSRTCHKTWPDEPKADRLTRIIQDGATDGAIDKVSLDELQLEDGRAVQ